MNEILISSIRIARFNRDTEFWCLSELDIQVFKITEISLIAQDFGINSIFIAFKTSEVEIGSIEDNNRQGISQGIFIHLLDRSYLYLQLVQLFLSSSLYRDFAIDFSYLLLIIIEILIEYTIIIKILSTYTLYVFTLIFQVVRDIEQDTDINYITYLRTIKL